MDNSEECLYSIEAQRSTGVSNDQRRYSTINRITNRVRSLIPRGILQHGEGMQARDIGSVPEFCNLTLPQFFLVCGSPALMTPEIFSAVSSGNQEYSRMAYLRSDHGDSILHLAATWGHLELVKSMLSHCPSLFLHRNSENRIPLHVAAHAGWFAVVEALVAMVTTVSTTLSEEERKKLNPYVWKDTKGDTPLHLALKGRHMKTVACLVNANKKASFVANEDRISPLYLAVEAGNVSLVTAMLNTTANDNLQVRESNLHSQLEGWKYLVHTALKSKNTDTLVVILNEYPSLQDERDEEGRTCLSFAASIGYYEGVCSLLDRSTNNVYVRENDGSFPIHLAATNGDTEIVKEILKRCPYSKHLLNSEGQNMLHIAAKSGNYLLVSYLMENYSSTHLIGGQDRDGNTPLHLATINWHHRALLSLTLDVKRLYIRNNSGLTARDIAESMLKPNFILHERMTLMVLLHAHSSWGSETSIKSLTKPSHPLDGVKNKEYINALLLVAGLVATVTFAAGFTIPGGFNSSGPNVGRATMTTNPNLFIFLILDSLAMQSSVITIATLIWAQFGDPTLVQKSLLVALPCLLFSLLCMSVAFFFGVVTAVGHVTWFIIIISIITYFFFSLVLLILGSHVLLQLPYVQPFFGRYMLLFYYS